MTLCLFVLAMQMSIAQTTTKTSTVVAVPEIVQTTFNTEFPTLQAKWELDGKNYKAIYADPKTNSKGIIIYSAEGKVIKRASEINTSKPQ